MAPPGPSDEERRSHPRFAVYGRAAIRVLGEGRIQDGRVIGISRSGALLETSRLEIGTRVQAVFTDVLEPTMEVSGTVVREMAGVVGTNSPAIAVMFDELLRPIGRLVREELPLVVFWGGGRQLLAEIQLDGPRIPR